MSKTTKIPIPVRSIQKFNKSNTVNSITLAGTTALADVSIDKRGDVVLTLKRDNTKIDKVESTSDLLTIEKSGTTLIIGLDQQKLEEFIASKINK